MEFWESLLFVHDFKMTVWQADDTEYVYLASLHRDSMLHTQRHAYLVKKKHSPVDPRTHSSSTHACNRKYTAGTQERSLGNRKWQWMEEAVPKRRKIPSDLCHSEEGMREERGLGIYYNWKKRTVRHKLQFKEIESKLWMFFNDTQGFVLQLVDGFQILSFGF